MSSQVFSINDPKYEDDNQERKRAFLRNESDIIANQSVNPVPGNLWTIHRHPNV